LKSASLLLVFLFCAASNARAQAESPKYQEVFYASGNLRIQAYLYKPEGDGPFAAVMVPERRGYGKSDGEIWRNEVGRAQSQLIPRLEAEADDMLAAVDYLRGLPYVDVRRLAVMGWSFGGVVTMLATARSTVFVAAVDQAGGALTWAGNGYMRSALVGAAEKSTIPTLFMVAQNDRTTASITTLAEVFKKRNVPHGLVVYEPFTPSGEARTAAGHAIFSSQGASLWEKDVLAFLGTYLR